MDELPEIKTKTLLTSPCLTIEMQWHQ